MSKKIRYGLDVDGVCLDFGKSFIKTCKVQEIDLSIGKVWNFFDQDIRSYDIFKGLDTKFWSNLKREPKSLDLSITPVAYISHRSCPTEVTKKCLLKTGFPDSPTFHVKYTEDKVKLAKELGIDVFIDDRASTVMYFLENGIQAYCLDQIWNADFNVPRIHTLGDLKDDHVITRSHNTMTFVKSEGR